MKNQLAHHQAKSILIGKMILKINTVHWKPRVVETILTSHLIRDSESHISMVIKAWNKNTLKVYKHQNWQPCSRHHWETITESLQMDNKYNLEFQFYTGQYLTPRANHVSFRTIMKVPCLLAEWICSTKMGVYKIHKILKTSWSKTFHWKRC